MGRQGPSECSALDRGSVPRDQLVEGSLPWRVDFKGGSILRSHPGQGAPETASDYHGDCRWLHNTGRCPYHHYWSRLRKSRTRTEAERAEAARVAEANLLASLGREIAEDSPTRAVAFALGKLSS